jgi:hypothetical protein
MSRKAADETATTPEALIEPAHARGLRINNLYQVEDGWRADVNDRKQFYEFGKREDGGRSASSCARKGKARGPLTA